MAIPIDQDLLQEVKDYIRDNYGSKRKVRKGSWQTCRYIQVSTCLNDFDIHYDKSGAIVKQGCCLHSKTP